jgi:hypothetical protein
MHREERRYGRPFTIGEIHIKDGETTTLYRYFTIFEMGSSRADWLIGTLSREADLYGH